MEVSVLQRCLYYRGVRVVLVVRGVRVVLYYRGVCIIEVSEL